MFLLTYPLIPASSSSHALHGHFSGRRDDPSLGPSSPLAQEVLLSHGDTLTLTRVDRVTGRTSLITRTPLFARLLSAATIRPAHISGSSSSSSSSTSNNPPNSAIDNAIDGADRTMHRVFSALPGDSSLDAVLVGTDSGCACVLAWDERRGSFSVAARTGMLWRSGVRKAAGAAFSAVDPVGRCVAMAPFKGGPVFAMVGREAGQAGASYATFDSPREAPRPSAVMYDLCAVHVGYGNPTFASIECDPPQWRSDLKRGVRKGMSRKENRGLYLTATGSVPESGCTLVDLDGTSPFAAPSSDDPRDSKYLVTYTVQLGQKAVQHRVVCALPKGASRVIAIPAPIVDSKLAGCSGVLVCGEGTVEYHSLGIADGSGKNMILRMSLPKRRGDKAVPPASFPPQRRSARKRARDEVAAAADAGVNDESKKKKDDVESAPLVVAHVVISKGGELAVLVQTELGDLIKIVLVRGPGGEVTGLQAAYFDTIPVASAMCVAPAGYLYVCPESGDHAVYRFTSVDPGPPEDTFSVRPLANLEPVDQVDSLSGTTSLVRYPARAAITGGVGSTLGSLYALCGKGGRSTLRTLHKGLPVSVAAETELGIAPTAMWSVTIRNSSNSNTGGDAGSDDDDERSLWRTLIVAVSKQRSIVIEATDNGIEEVEPASSPVTCPPDTVHVAAMGDSAVIVVNRGGWTLFATGNNTSGSDRILQRWGIPGHRQIRCAATNSKELIIALTGGEVYHFRAPVTVSSSPTGLDEIARTNLDDTDVTSMALADVPPGRAGAAFALVALYDKTVRVLSLDASTSSGGSLSQSNSAADAHNMMMYGHAPAATGPASLEQLSVVSTDPDMPTSVALTEMAVAGQSGSTLFAIVGHDSGILSRHTIARDSGALSDMRRRVIGTGAVALSSLAATAGRPASVMAMSVPRNSAAANDNNNNNNNNNNNQAASGSNSNIKSGRAWLLHSSGGGKPEVSSLATDPFAMACSFPAPSLPEAVAVVSGTVLRVIATERSAGAFHSTQVPLRYTPRSAAPLFPLGTREGKSNDGSEYLVVCEADFDVHAPTQKCLRADGVNSSETAPSGPTTYSAMDELPDEDEEDDGVNCNNNKNSVKLEPNADGYNNQGQILPTERQFGQVRKRSSKSWASCVRLVNASRAATMYIEELGGDRAALCITVCSFSEEHRARSIENGDRDMVIVGGSVGLDWSTSPPTGTGFIAVFTVNYDASTGSPLRLKLLHVTNVEDPVHALCPFHGRLLCGVGGVLRLYDLGGKSLLRKCELAGFPSFIRSLHAVGPRVFACDAAESVHVVVYRASHNRFAMVADDSNPRRITASVVLDHATIAVADRFGNISVLRVPNADDTDPTGDGNSLAAGGPMHRGEDLSSDPALKWWARGHLNGFSEKLESVAEFHLGHVVTSLTRGTLQAGGTECIVYACATGAVGALVPFRARADAVFFGALEGAMRGVKSLPAAAAGRDHMAFRGAYFPVRGVVDGELCAGFSAAGAGARKEVVEAMGASSEEDVARAIEEFGDRVV